MGKWWAWLLGLLLVCGIWSGLQASGSMGYSDYKEHPEAHDGEDLTLTLVVVSAVEPERYEVRKGTLPFWVIGRGPSVGEELTVGGVFRASDGALVEEWTAPAPGRGGKKRLGVLGLLIGLGIFARTFQFRWPMVLRG